MVKDAEFYRRKYYEALAAFFALMSFSGGTIAFLLHYIQEHCRG